MVNYANQLNWYYSYLNYIISYFVYGLNVQLLSKISEFTNIYFIWFLKVVSLGIMFFAV